jgi:hypothetical protein
LIIVLPADWEELFFFSSALLVLVLVLLKQSLGFIIGMGFGHTFLKIKFRLH